MTAIKFGTDGWRDLMYDRFNLPNVRLVVQAIARYVQQHQGQPRGVVVGYDARFFSDFFAQEAARILAAHDIRVYLCRRDYPTPAIAFAVKQHQAFGAIIFTASHNPPQYNGIKFLPEYAGPASLEITQAIEVNLAKVQPLPETELATIAELEARGQLQLIDPTPKYLDHLRSLVNVAAVTKSGLNLVIDPMYAAGRGFLAQLFAESPLQELHSQRDPLFGGALPDPQGKYLDELAAAVRQRQPAIGLATDGDADRFGIIDSDGSFLTPNQVITLLLEHLVKTRGGSGIAVRTVSTTHMIDHLAAAYGLETVETPVGFKFIGELMRSREVLIGGEESGGLSIRGHLPEKDGILACALMAEMRAVTGKPLRASLTAIESRIGSFHTQRLDCHLTEDAKMWVLERCQTSPPTQIAGLQVQEVRTTDGYKFLLEQEAWFLIRPSGTEALVRIYFEAHTPEQLKQLVAAVQQLVEEWGQGR